MIAKLDSEIQQRFKVGSLIRYLDLESRILYSKNGQKNIDDKLNERIEKKIIYEDSQRLLNCPQGRFLENV